MIAVPADIPVTRVEDPTDVVAIAVLLLLHVPPDVVSLKIIVLPVHTAEGPEIEPMVGKTLMVTAMVARTVSVPSTTAILKLSVPE